jgi:hypothetical protein
MTGSSENVAPAVPKEGGPPRGTGKTVAATGWRRWVPWVLIFLAAIIALLAALNIWVKRQALSTDKWTESSTALLENDDVRNAVAVYVVDQLYENVDVGAALEERLPEATKPLAPTLAAALQPALVRTMDTLLGRPRVQQLWTEANRRAHQLLIALLDGNHEVLLATGGNVVLDLRQLLEQLVEQTGIGERVLEQLPPDAGKITVIKGSQLETARKAVKAVRFFSYFLTFLVLALVALAIWIAHGRRRTMLMATGVSLLIVGLIVLIVRRVGGNYLVDALTSNVDAERPVSAVWAIETNLLRNVGINVVIYGLVGIFAAWIAGPSRPAVALRRWSAPTMRDRPVLVYGILAVLLLVLLASGPTDGQRVYPLLLLFVLAFVGLEYLRRQTAREFPATAAIVVPDT